jgi:hypothetical protein
MSRADDFFSSIQKAVGDRPVLLLAGAGDLVSEKLRELPDAVSAWQAENRDFPMRAAGALIGSAFRANLRVGEFYDELTRRGEDVLTKMRGDEVVAEEDEPFLHEPFMPEPVRPPSHSAKAQATSTTAAATKAAAKKKAGATKAAATKSAAKSTSMKSSRKSAAKESATKSAAKKNASRRAVAKSAAKSATKKSATTSAAAK